MKQDWTYKKLGEVCTIERGGSPRPINEYITDDPNGLNWIKIGDAKEGSKYITSTKEKIKPEGLKKTRLVHKGNFILSNSMSFGKPYILDIDGCIHDGWLVIHDDNGSFDKSFLYYLLGSPNMYMEFQRLAVGGVVNNLNSEIVRNVIVPIPPLEVQSQIVKELDLLQSIIDKQKMQLKELDNLAQAVFYDMFGDPVENEKGWEVKRLEELGTCVSGGTPSRKNTNYFMGNINWYSAGELNSLFLGESIEKITQEALDNSSAKLCKAFSLYIGMYDTAAFKLGISKTQSASNQACANIFPNEANVIWLYYTLFIMREEALKHRHGVRQKNLNLSFIKSFTVPYPPLSLQQSFAAKIEAIEKQKAAIGKCMEETQKLFDYSMDKYFG